MTISDLLPQAVVRLQTSNSDEPQANAEWLLACVLGVTRTWLLAHPDYTLTDKELAVYDTYITRKAAGEPLSHIVGYQPFDGLDIIVTPDVLTPRPETEELVDLVTALFDKKGSYQFIDMCSGSGCIACALARRFLRAQVMAVDISEKALAVAQKNVQKFHLQERVHLLQSNLWEQVQGTFDLIISNPPYIPSSIVDTLTREVLHEPRLALDGGADGLEVVRPLCTLAADYLNPGGWLALELCQGQAAAVARGLDEFGWNTSVKKDIVGIERFVLAQKI
ncbi:MAG: peptide chain release factor N(5)-glutamine methyltransferase [Elusimicrobiaceae bacterium]|nr:peptide chain release factor N(5)-glutamine methyltransferase [Elusimicrobiaceae bacterium]